MIRQVRWECKDGELEERGFQEREMELIGHVLFLTIWKSVMKTFFLLLLSSGKIKGMYIETKQMGKK